MSSETFTADYALSPDELRAALVPLVEMQQPTMVWGPPGVGKSTIARAVAEQTGRQYLDIYALTKDPVDLTGIPWKDKSNRTRWATPEFFPPSNSGDKFLINIEELPGALPMVQNALYQLLLDRRHGEYELPPNAAVIACGNREMDRAGTHRMSTPLASRMVHLDIQCDAPDWLRWAASNGIEPEVLFFIQFRPELLHAFDPQSKEHTFPCPRTWEFVSKQLRSGLMQSGSPSVSDDKVQRAMFRGAVGEAAAVEFTGFLKVWREMPHPRAIFNDPAGSEIPENPSALLALCGALYRLVDDTRMDSLTTYAQRLRPEIGAFLVDSCVRRDPKLMHTAAYIRWEAAEATL